MAHACPNLVALDLSPRDTQRADVPRITLEGLIPLAQLCPHLEEICIAFDPELVVSEEVQHRVDQMTFRNSVTCIAPNRGRDCDREGAQQLAQFVMRLFPKLSEIRWAIRDDEDFSDISMDYGANPRYGFLDDEGGMDPDNGPDDEVGFDNESEEGLGGLSNLRDIWYHVGKIINEKSNSHV